MSENLLHYGDNLDILRRYIKDETVDLTYLDPPFTSNVTYNVLLGEQNGSQAAARSRRLRIHGDEIGPRREPTRKWRKPAARGRPATILHTAPRRQTRQDA